jgi:hypothetical protein
MEEPKAEPCVAALSAGGVEVRLEGPGVTGTEAYAIWQKIYDTVGNGRNRIGSGTGFIPDRAEPVEASLWLGEGGPKAFGDIRSEEGKRAAERLSKPPGCFHPWPGCNCGK